MPPLSELEGCVLGVVGAGGPLTAYAIRRVFLDSPSPYWSGSAGAIYPLIRRLEKRGLVRSAPHSTGARASRLYRLTPAGSRLLGKWLGPPVPDWVAAVPADSLRTRLSFLGALAPAARIAFMEEARRKMKGHLAVVKVDLRRASGGTDPYERLVARGALLALRARLAWVEEVLRVLRKAEP